MKKIIVLSACICLSGIAFSQLRFSVSPILSYKGASFGYKIKKVVPTVSFFAASYSFLTSYTDKDMIYSNELVFKTMSTEYKVQALIPTLGFQYYITEHENLKTYASINYSMLLMKGKILTEDSGFFVDEMEKPIVHGGQIGFGTEYSFSRQFSVSGEVGFQLINYKLRNTFPQSYYDDNTNTQVYYDDVELTTLHVAPIYTRIALNFQFGK